MDPDNIANLYDNARLKLLKPLVQAASPFANLETSHQILYTSVFPLVYAPFRATKNDNPKNRRPLLPLRKSAKVESSAFSLVFRILPKDVWRFAEAVGHFSKVIASSGSSLDLPACSLDFPASSLDFPASSLDLPAVSLDLPASSLDFPASLLDFPAACLD